MKLIGRTLAILVAAMVVVGITLAFGSSSLASGANDGPPDRPAVASGQATNASAANRPPRGHGESEGFSLFGIVEVLKNLGIVGLIIAIVTLGKRLISRGRHAPKSRRPPPTAAPSL